MNQNGTFLPTSINKIDADFEVIQQVLVLGVFEGNGHPNELEVVAGVLEGVEELFRREGGLGGGGDVGHVELGDLIGRDGEAGAPFGEKGYGSGA